MKTAKHLFYLIFSCFLLSSCGENNSLKQEQAEQAIKSFLTLHRFESEKEIISVETIRKIDKTNVFTQFNSSVKVHFSGKPETRDTHLLFIFRRTTENEWYLESIDFVSEASPELAGWLATKKKLKIKV